MPKLVINGQNRIVGEVTVQGAKNSVLPIIAATILCKGESVIHNCPDLSDVEVSLKIIKALGGTYVREGCSSLLLSLQLSLASFQLFLCSSMKSLMKAIRRFLMSLLKEEMLRLNKIEVF